MTRKVAMITGKGEVRLEKDSLPELGENEVAIRVHASLISPGTEIGGVRRLREKPDPEAKPRTFGYACAGEVVETRGDARGLEPGQRVMAMGGGALHADFVHVPINLVVPIPDAVPYEEAVYACLGATALQAVYRAAPILGDYGLILGLGVVGNLATQLSRISGARVLAWETLAGRRGMAENCGIEATVDPRDGDGVKAATDWAAPYGMDFAILAFGGDATAAFDDVVKVMKVSADTHQMGAIVLVGGCQIRLGGGATSGNLDIRASSRTGPGYHDKQWEKGADYPNAVVPRTTQRNLREILALIEEGRLAVEPMTTHRLPLAEVGRAADLLIDNPNEALGIVLQAE